MKTYFLLFMAFFASCGMFKKGDKMILNGSTSQAALTRNKNFSWFNIEFIKYKPDTVIVNKLKPLKDELKILIIAGTWCSDTQRELPRFLKIANSIGIDSKNIEIIMVNESKVCQTFNISVLQVTNIPTFIVFKDGREQGRIIEKPRITLEEDLAQLLKLM